MDSPPETAASGVPHASKAPDPPRPGDYESTPLTRPEYIAAIVHLYRGELHRANMWRLRLDHTTNLAVLTTAGLMTYTFGEGEHQHWVLLGGLTLVTFFLIIEARRFRFADVWRARVRMIEENFYGPILRRDPVGVRNDWGKLVAEDLFRPRFKMSALTAIRGRLARNYWAIYLVILTAWTLKVLFVPFPIKTWEGLRSRLGDGLVPWWASLAFVGSFVVAVSLLMLLGTRVTSYDLEQWRYEREVRKREGNIDM